MKKPGLLLFLLALTVTLSGCATYQTGWVPYQPQAVLQHDPAPKQDARPDGQMDGQTDGQMDGQTDGQMDGQTDGRTDGRTDAFIIWGEVDATELHLFTAHHPELEVQVIPQDPSSWRTVWITSLAAGEGPDVFSYDAATAGWSATLDIFEDLSGEAYSLDELQPLMTDAEWTETLSFDGSQRVYLPVFTYPAMLFYRADILNAHDLPYEPDALAEYLKAPSNWLHMVRSLHESGHIAMEWRGSPWNQGSRMSTPFGMDMAWRFQTPEFRDILQATVNADKENLRGDLNIWVESGKDALTSGKLVMCVMGSWGVELLPQWVPAQKSLWRVTRLPMGLESEWGTKWMSISNMSGHKAEAWELLESNVKTIRMRNARAEEIGNPFFAGQMVRVLEKSMRQEMQPQLHTPLDEEVAGLFDDQLFLIYDGHMPASDFLRIVDEDIQRRYEWEITALKEVRGLE